MALKHYARLLTHIAHSHLSPPPRYRLLASRLAHEDRIYKTRSLELEELRGENLMIKQVLRMIASDPKAKSLQAIGDTYKRIVSWDQEDAADAKNATNEEEAKKYADNAEIRGARGGRKRDGEGVKEKGGEPSESSDVETDLVPHSQGSSRPGSAPAVSREMRCLSHRPFQPTLSPRRFAVTSSKKSSNSSSSSSSNRRRSSRRSSSKNRGDSKHLRARQDASFESRRHRNLRR